MNLSAHARRQVQQRATELVGGEFPGLGALPRQVLAALLAHTAAGWRLFVREGFGGAREAGADVFLIGPGGVFAVVVDERLPDLDAARALMRHAQHRLSGIGYGLRTLAGSGIHLVVVGPNGGRSTNGMYLSLALTELPRLFRRDALHLDRRQVESISEAAAGRLAGYRRLSVRAPGREPEPTGLLDVRELTEDQVAAAQQRPFDSWLTFLHPHQQAVVTRRYNGPARISGPAGTGKTVVALHRLRHLARRSTDPLLFTTFVRTLPLVHQRSFERLAPELADRVEFTNLHAWVRGFLAQRGIHVNVHSGQIRTQFNLAWRGHREVLGALEPRPEYWRDEVDRVIKGRGVESLADYLRLSRRGRSLRLDANQKRLVWALYQDYEKLLQDKGLRDHNDLITLAAQELGGKGLERPYAAVVADEVQDISLQGLRLLRTIAGDGPDRLLLVGDGQQQVYPGGWRLSDAGIPIQGRGEVLRVNYRNRAEVLEFARRFDATNQVDDLDGAVGIALQEAESANSGGRTESWRGPVADLPAALVEVVRGLPVPVGRTAVIALHRRELEACRDALRAAGVPVLWLEDYTGQEDGKLKIGTVHRAKGLDFQAVLVVQFARHEAVDEEARELRGRQHLVAATRARDYLWWGTAESA
ncbi:UvrD-helicase domain-containing protein [Kutzneria viridogrisea]|uniref:UvrD-like helicase ATP-binding domain-containing protein n=1 Tax=Kutzneria viridogrisea TaxID=47990 RepID=A0ABR6BDV6_9PSEU|nr:hypothetical protein [Kutzneria viridogrisea]